MSGSLAAFTVLLFLAGPVQAAGFQQDTGVPPATGAGQAAAPAATKPAEPDPATDFPVSLSRIRKGLETEPKLKLDLPIRDDIPRFYVDVTATPDIQTFLKGADLLHGPVPGAAPTHADMMALVTPKELYSSAGFDGLSMLTANLTGALIYLAQKGFKALANARTEHERQAIREEIQRELAQLEKLNAEKAKSDKSEKKGPGGPPS